MIRRQSLQEQLYYAHEEIAKPSSSNFYRRLNEAVGDWEGLAKPFGRTFSCGIGRPTDPVVYLKIFVVGYLENIVYDTDLAERIGDSIAIREFLGYSLCESTPDHSSISRNRARIAESCRIEDVLSRVVEGCEKAGLVDGEVSAVDSSLKSLKTGKRVAEHLREVKERNKESAAAGDGGKEKLVVSNDEFRSATDPDARIAKKPGQPKDMCYKATHVTDSKGGIILAAGVECADKGDVEAAEGVVLEAKRNLGRCGLGLGTLAADAQYDSAGFHA